MKFDLLVLAIVWCIVCAGVPPLVNAPSTVANLAGVVVFVGAVWASIETYVHHKNRP